MPSRPLLLGHRGARAEKSVPENTLDSFDLALAHGCDGFEFDVRLSSNGQPVICHDADIRDLEVAQTSAQQLGLPLLHQVLQRYQTTAFLDIELKVPGLERITLELLRSHPPLRGCVVSSFLPEVLEAIHDMDTAIPLGLICETPAQFRVWRAMPGQYVILHRSLLRQSSIRKIQGAGGKIFVWTVNAASEMKRCVEWGVDGIVSDDPQRLAALINRRPKSEDKT
jgi:glycerophosphoryl diester phosphodiesterase